MEFACSTTESGDLPGADIKMRAMIFAIVKTLIELLVICRHLP
jgi:hypothetical protein